VENDKLSSDKARLEAEVDDYNGSSKNSNNNNNNTKTKTTKSTAHAKAALIG
jgi:hypothetical protein